MNISWYIVIFLLFLCKIPTMVKKLGATTWPCYVQILVIMSCVINGRTVICKEPARVCMDIYEGKG